MPLPQENEETPERAISPEEFLALQKRAIRRKAVWSMGIGAALTVFSIAATWILVNYFPEVLEEAKLEDKSFIAILFRNILFLLGLFFVAGGAWGIFHAKNLKIDDFIPSPEAVEFIEAARGTTPFYSYILVSSLVIVAFFQLKAENFENFFFFGEKSAEIAGLVKPLVRQGEWWRILTAGTLHYGFLHIYLNCQAFYGFGSAIEYFADRAHLTIVFLLAVIGGGLMSLFFMPTGISVGASGGIMGLVGYLAVYGYRRQRHLPPNFLRSMLVNIGFIAAFGVIGYKFIDNFGHLGGLLVGVAYGFLQVPRDLSKNPRAANVFIKALGALALIAFVAACLFSILRLSGVF